MDKRLEDKKIPEPEGKKKPDTSAAAGGTSFQKSLCRNQFTG